MKLILRGPEDSVRRQWLVVLILVVLFVFVSHTFAADDVTPLPGTQPLTVEGDLSALMRAGIDKYLTRETENSVKDRAQFWNRDFSSAEAYNKSVAPNRERFRKMIGVVDERVRMTGPELVGSLTRSAILSENDSFVIYEIRWPVLEGVFGEGLLLRPKLDTFGPRAHVIVLPDADQTPEMLAGLTKGIEPKSQFARRLAEAGCEVIVPVLIDLRDNWSGNPNVWMTNQPHREWIYRLSYTFGRHIIGYEVQKVLALVDYWRPTITVGFETKDRSPLIVAGYGEGGLIALYSAACDERIDGALVSGYFDSRQFVHEEPIYRNVFGLLREFGDAEIASLVYPRPLIIEHSKVAEVNGPPTARDGCRAVAAPGRIGTPYNDTVQIEHERARLLVDTKLVLPDAAAFLVAGEGGTPLEFGSTLALKLLLDKLGLDKVGIKTNSGAIPLGARLPDTDARQERQVKQLVEHTQRLLRLSPHARAAFWKDAQPKSAETWASDVATYRDYFHDEIVGRYPPPSLPPNARTRRIFERPKWDCYEVLLDVYDDVFTWGWLAVPKGMANDEKRPVVVCQHGLEGLPADVFEEKQDTGSYKTYRAYASRLADMGYVVYAPHNFYRGGNEFRQLQRKANPLKKTLFGLTVQQHIQLTNWLASLPFVDGQRIAFYGLSYGGSSASRLPPLVPKYAMVINSANFNEGINKAANVDYNYSYIFHNTYEWFEWNAGNTFSDGDMAALIAPRPYMVERGHQDGVAPDEWVAGEYARVRRLYAQLGIPENTEIEFFNGGHVINGQGTFEFLKKHLKWPK